VAALLLGGLRFSAEAVGFSIREDGTAPSMRPADPAGDPRLRCRRDEPFSPNCQPAPTFALGPHLRARHLPVPPFHQRGTASWYGRQFQGNRTASGEPYDMFAMTAAHPTLPIPSYAPRHERGATAVR